MKNIGIVWFRNDLRLDDNEALTNAINSCDEVLSVFVFDERLFYGNTPFGFRKTGYFRSKFIIESVENLRANLREKGSDLIIAHGKPEEIIAELAINIKASWVFCNREMTYEEIKVQDSLEQNLWAGGREIFYSRGKMLYYTADLPFPILHTPDLFSQFRKEVEKIVPIRKPLPLPATFKTYKDVEIEAGSIPTLSEFGFDGQEQEQINFVGGEDAGKNQLKHFLWETGCICRLKETRNELIGWNQSSKFSPWLAVGALSPKTIYHEVKKFEQIHGQSDGTFLLNLELVRRDFYRLVGKKYGTAIFLPGGMTGKKPESSKEIPVFMAWVNGETGNPFIDANMKVLSATGYLSYRSRQIVANYLIKDLGIYWLWGAEYFESILLDYDPCSNYCNWALLAGVGNDPREERIYNVLTYAQKNDPNGYFVKKWLPMLSTLPDEYIHAPDLVDTAILNHHGVYLGDTYPMALVSSSKWS